MTQKRIVFFVALFLIILVLIPVIISKVSKQLNNPIPNPSPVLLPTKVISSPTVAVSFPPSGLEMIIFKDKEASVPYANMTIKLTSIFVAPKQCMDCVTAAGIQIRENQQLKELKYIIGGIAGTIIDKQEAFGYSFTIKDLQKDSLTVKINKK